MSTSFYRRKSVEELTFTDDGMFQAVMRDPALCTELIEGLNFGDKITKMIYNASGYEKETDERVRKFLQFVFTNNPSDDDFSNRLKDRVSKLKDDEQFKEVYAAMNLREMDIRREAIAEGIQLGLIRGAKEKAIEAAVIAVRDFNIAPQLAAQKMNVPLERLMEELGNPTYAQNHENDL